MKHLLTLFITLVMLSCNAQEVTTEKTRHYVSFKNFSELQAYLKYQPNSQALVSAHRGGPETGYPENAIETFDNVLLYAPCIIECDVRATSDGKLVMMHDDTLDRTTTGSGLVSEKTWAELQQLKLKDNEGNETNFRIPTLDQILVWAKDKAILSLDVKRGVEAQKVVDAINKAQARSHVMVIVYNIEDLQKFYSLDKNLMISVSGGSVEQVKRVLDTGVAASNLLMFVGVSEPSKEVYEELHRHGIRSILGTMHNLDHKAEKHGVKVYQELISNGADVLATDNPALAAKAIYSNNK